MNKILLIVIALTIACKDNVPEQVNTEQMEAPIAVQKSNVQKEVSRCEFDIHKYKKGFDSLTYKNIGPSTKTIFVSKRLKSGELIFKELTNTNLSTITKQTLMTDKYSFSIADGDKRQQHHLAVLKFKNDNEAKLAFEIFERVSFEKSGIPGLTYTNDYIELHNNVIFWLNSSCAYSHERHGEFIKLFIGLCDTETTSKIVCNCGEVVCK